MRDVGDAAPRRHPIRRRPPVIAPMGDWNPWRALRERPHIELVWSQFPDGARGAWVPGAARSIIALDVRLRRRERRAVLTHELVHDERGIAYTSGTPPLLIAKEERAVDLEAARRLVPLDELRRFVAQRRELEPITVTDIAAAFDVPPDVARRAVDLLVATAH